MIVFSRLFAKAALCAAFAVALCHAGLAQGTVSVKKPTAAPEKKTATSLPKVTQIDIEGLRKLLKPNGKPLLINFWATWCDPCREEFPDLVRIDEEFAGKIDFKTVSLDDLADIKTHVPKFLSEVESKMPAFLLHTPDESVAIRMVSTTWRGNLPMTILYNSDGAVAYSRNGKIRFESLKTELDKLINPIPSKPTSQLPK